MSTHLSEELNSERWGEKIRALRKEHAWSQKDLAERLGVHKQTVSDIERGRNQFTLERLNRILDVLGYDATIELSPSEKQTRAAWGPISAKDPDLRRRTKLARQFAEKLADELYAEYDVNAVYCFGSLAENGGTNFNEQSDVDLLVAGLEPSDLFEAQSHLEIEVAKSRRKFEDFSFDLIRAESFDVAPDQLKEDDDTIYLPQP